MRFLQWIPNALILASLLYLTSSFWPVLTAEAKYRFDHWRGVKYEIVESDVLGNFTAKNSPQNDFGQLLTIGPTIGIEPISKEAAIIIEKINVNAPIVMDVPVTDKNKYNEALKNGVAHAAGTAYPGNSGNAYLFAHSTVNPLEIQRYSAVFTLLNKVERGDRIVVFFRNQRYDYLVEEKEVVASFNTKPLLRTYDYPVLTLQTCDPPGIPRNRLIVTAKLVGEYLE